MQPRENRATDRLPWTALAVMNGMPLQVIAKNAGHASVAITEKRYAHLAPSFLSEEVKRNAPTFGIKANNLSAIRR
jgi:hypothetical protein